MGSLTHIFSTIVRIALGRVSSRVGGFTKTIGRIHSVEYHMRHHTRKHERKMKGERIRNDKEFFRWDSETRRISTAGLYYSDAALENLAGLVFHSRLVCRNIERLDSILVVVFDFSWR